MSNPISSLAMQAAAQGAKIEGGAALQETRSQGIVAREERLHHAINGIRKVVEPIQSASATLGQLCPHPITEALDQAVTNVSSRLDHWDDVSTLRANEAENVKDEAVVEKILGKLIRKTATKVAIATEVFPFVVQNSLPILPLSESAAAMTLPVVVNAGIAASDVLGNVDVDCDYVWNRLSKMISRFRNGRPSPLVERAKQAIVAIIKIPTLGRCPDGQAACELGIQTAIAIDDAAKEAGRIGKQVVDKLPTAVGNALHSQVTAQTENGINSLLDRAQERLEGPIHEQFKNVKARVTGYAESVLGDDDTAEFLGSVERIANRETASCRTCVQRGVRKIRDGIKGALLSVADLCGQRLRHRYMAVPQNLP